MSNLLQKCEWAEHQKIRGPSQTTIDLYSLLRFCPNDFFFLIFWSYLEQLRFHHTKRFLRRLLE